MDQPPPAETPRKAFARSLTTLCRFFILAIVLIVTGSIQPANMAGEWLIHSQGTLAQSSECKVVFHGSGRSGNYEMEVDYVSADGASHHDVESLLFVLWLLNPDQSQPCEVRYDPRWPNLYGTSWGFGRLPSRFVTWLVFEAWLLVAGVALLVVLLRAVWQPLFARRD